MQAHTSSVQVSGKSLAHLQQSLVAINPPEFMHDFATEEVGTLEGDSVAAVGLLEGMAVGAGVAKLMVSTAQTWPLSSPKYSVVPSALILMSPRPPVSVGSSQIISPVAALTFLRIALENELPIL